MDNFATASMIRHIMSLRTDLPVSFLVYSIEAATDILGKNINDEQWQDIYAEFEEQSDELVSDLFTLFTDIAFRVVNGKENN